MGKAKKKSFGLALSSEPYKNQKQAVEKLEVSKEQPQDTFSSQAENTAIKKSNTKNESKKPIQQKSIIDFLCLIFNSFFFLYPYL
jgi:hypothetical protein